VTGGGGSGDVGSAWSADKFRKPIFVATCNP
jgi:hypothetical protein